MNKDVMGVQEVSPGYEFVAENPAVPVGYKQTEVGVIPNDWDSVPIGSLFKFKNGLNKEKKYFGHGTPIVNYMDVFKHSGLACKDIQGRVTLSKQEIDRFDVREGDVFFTRTSETVDEIGTSAVMLESPESTAFSGFILRARPSNSSLSNGYKKYCFSTAAVRAQIVATATYTTRALTNGRALSEVFIPLPPKREQHAIATALSDVDALLEELDRLIAKKRDIKQAAMQQLLTGEIRLPGFEGEWEARRIGDVLEVRHGRSQKEVETKDGEYPIYASGGEIGRANTYLYSKPSVLIGRKGTIDAPRYCDQPFWTVDTLFYTELLDRNSAKFMYYKFCMIPWRNYNEASGVPSLSARTIENIEIVLPTHEEQEAIAAVLSDMDTEIQALEQRRSKTAKLKQGMMQELLTGRTRLV